MQSVITQAVGEMARKHDGSSILLLETCEYLNISVCPAISESKDQVYNLFTSHYNYKAVSSLTLLSIIQEDMKMMELL